MSFLELANLGRVDKILDQYEKETGEKLSPEIRQKLIDIETIASTKDVKHFLECLEGNPEVSHFEFASRKCTVFLYEPIPLITPALNKTFKEFFPPKKIPLIVQYVQETGKQIPHHIRNILLSMEFNTLDELKRIINVFGESNDTGIPREFKFEEVPKKPDYLPQWYEET